MRGDLTETATQADIVSREAQAWVSRLTSGDATAADLAQFECWRATSPVHRQAFAQAKLLWNVMGPAAELSRTRSVALGLVGDRSQSRRAIGRRVFLGGAMAASVAGVAVMAARPPLGLWPSLSEVMSDYRTAKGEIREINLADVSLKLNSQTSIALHPASADTDLIELISGETSVAAERNPTRYVSVIAGGGRATARNATFNVRHAGSSGCVSCKTGEVIVAHGGAEVRLRPQQQVSYDGQGLQAVVVTDLAVVTAWQRGMLVFRSDPLARVIEEVNRYRPGRIVVMNDELGRRQVVANFRIDRLEDVVPRLQAVFNIRVRSLPGGVVLLS
jgi:transmembrane sensor